VNPNKVLNRWKNFFCQLLNVQGTGGGRQTKIHTAEPFVPELSASEFEVASGNLKRYKLPGSDQSSRTDLSRVGETLHSETSSLAYSSYSLTIDSFKMIAHSSQSSPISSLAMFSGHPPHNPAILTLVFQVCLNETNSVRTGKDLASFLFRLA
jgi:hypothetical protein